MISQLELESTWLTSQGTNINCTQTPRLTVDCTAGFVPLRKLKKTTAAVTANSALFHLGQKISPSTARGYKETHHSNDPNTVAACKQSQTLP